VYAIGDAKGRKAAYDSHCKNCHVEIGVANPNIAKMNRFSRRSVTGKAVDDVVAYIRKLISKGPHMCR
jgi:hypothetical protein